MMEVDWSVGQILDCLSRNGLDDNTLVVFTSDNGPWLSYGDHAGSAAPLREGKGTMFEGGCREPTIMRWPGSIPAGTKCSVPAMTIDILPTMAALIGAELPDHPIDGKNIWPLMAGEPDATSPHEAYYFYWGSDLHAVRSGKWKLHFPHSYRTMAGRPGGTNGIPTKYSTGQIGLSLFDLSVDVGETTNVADEHPEVVQRLTRLADQIRQELGDGKKLKGQGVRPAGRI
jgi:arylsulfatase A-like enzyme